MLTKRGDVYVADLRDVGGGRQSLLTGNKDLARLLHNEIEQRVLKGEAVNRGVVKGMLATLQSPRPMLSPTLPPIFTPQQAVQSKQPAGITITQAFQMAKLEHENWRTSKSPRTIEDNFNFVAEHFGKNHPLSAIYTSDIAKWRMAMLTDKKSASTINQRMSLLSVLFDVAEEAGHPLDKPRFKRLKPAKHRKRILSMSEERNVVAYFAHTKHPQDAIMADLVVCLADSGFRLNEMLSVRVSTHVNWETHRVYAYDTKNGEDRAVPMTKRMQAIIKRRGENPFEGLTSDSAEHRWQKMRKALGLQHDKPFVLHALRHTCCTRLAAKGMDAFRIMQWMGHKNIATTLIYVNLAGAMLDELRDALESVSDFAEAEPTVIVPKSAGARVPETTHSDAD